MEGAWGSTAENSPIAIGVGLKKFLARKPRSKSVGRESQLTDPNSSITSPSVTNASQEETTLFEVKGYWLDNEEQNEANGDEEEELAGNDVDSPPMIHQAPYLRPGKIRMTAREEPRLKPRDDNPDAPLTSIGVARRIGETRARLERGRGRDISTEELRSLRAEWEKSSFPREMLSIINREIKQREPHGSSEVSSDHSSASKGSALVVQTSGYNGMTGRELQQSYAPSFSRSSSVYSTTPHGSVLVSPATESGSVIESSGLPSLADGTNSETDPPSVADNSRSDVMDEIDIYGDWMSMDVASSVRCLALRIGTPEVFKDWCEYLELYYQGQLNNSNLPDIPSPSSLSFLPALYPASENQRLVACRRYENVLASWDGSNVLRSFDDRLAALNTEFALFSTLDEEAEIVRCSNVPFSSSFRRVVSLAAHALYAQLNVLVVPDASKDWRFCKNPLVEDGIRFFAAAPVIMTNSSEALGMAPRSEALGVLFVASKQARRALDIHARQAIMNMAGEIMKDIDRARVQLEGNNHRNKVFQWKELQDDDSMSRSDSYTYHGHTRQESVIDPKLIPQALSFFKTPPPEYGFETTSFQDQHDDQQYYHQSDQQFQDAGNESNLSYTDDYSTYEGTDRRRFSSGTGPFDLEPLASLQNYSTYVAEEERDRDQRGFAGNETAMENENGIDHSGHYTHMTERMSDFSLRSTTEQQRSSLTAGPSGRQSAGSVMQGKLSGRASQSPTFELPGSQFSISANIDSLCQELMTEMEYDMVYVVEIISGNQIRMLGTVDKNICSIDVSIFCKALQQDRAQQWTSTSYAAFATGDIMPLHSNDPASSSENRSSGFVGVCLRSMIPKEKRVRSHDLIRLVKFKADFKKILCPTPATSRRATLRKDSMPISDMFPASEGTASPALSSTRRFTLRKNSTPIEGNFSVGVGEAIISPTASSFRRSTLRKNSTPIDQTSQGEGVVSPTASSFRGPTLRKISTPINATFLGGEVVVSPTSSSFRGPTLRKTSVRIEGYSPAGAAMVSPTASSFRGSTLRKNSAPIDEAFPAGEATEVVIPE